MKTTTEELSKRIDGIRSIDELRELTSSLPKTTFCVKISELCQSHGVSFSQAQIASGITKSLFYAIANGTRKPKKAHIIKIGFAIGLSKEEINELLKLANLKELYPKKEEDLIIIYGLNNHLDIDQIEELLIKYGATLRLLEE